MKTAAHVTATGPAPVPASWAPPAQMVLLRRKCACGGGAGLTGECEECRQGRLGGAPSIQAKLRIGPPDDRYEREADRVAEAVAASGVPGGGPPVRQGAAEGVQRQAATETEEEPAAEAGTVLEEDDEEGIVGDESGWPKLAPGAAPATPKTVRLDVSRGGGSPLEPGVRRTMEERIGFDFGRARVHADERAAAASHRVRAHAFTVGSDVFFDRGRYDPGSTAGVKLLAHELTHVVQQAGPGRASAGAAGTVQRKPKCREGGCDGNCVPSKAPIYHPWAHGCKNETCSTGRPASATDFIRLLNVRRAAHVVDIEWGPRSAKKPATKVEHWPCSPSTSSGKDGKVPTPTADDKIGLKCSACHTNSNGDGMACFAGFASKSLGIGFHNSQKVGKAHESHGCVRVGCGHSKAINQNTWSGVSRITVDKPKLAAPAAGGTAAPKKGAGGGKGAAAYTVKAGDTLSEIAAAQGVSVEALAKAKDIEDPSLIREGQVLTIPEGASE
ncbi:MAG TPA: DUF4157 domain-containing protein [Thermoanaerobaculia bacterium]|nr:DUF4157 domain-containing protein [Thermoanaerobaculia bacterium]